MNYYSIWCDDKFFVFILWTAQWAANYHLYWVIIIVCKAKAKTQVDMFLTCLRFNCDMRWKAIENFVSHWFTSVLCFVIIISNYHSNILYSVMRPRDWLTEQLVKKYSTFRHRGSCIMYFYVFCIFLSHIFFYNKWLHIIGNCNLNISSLTCSHCFFPFLFFPTCPPLKIMFHLLRSHLNHTLDLYGNCEKLYQQCVLTANCSLSVRLRDTSLHCAWWLYPVTFYSFVFYFLCLFSSLYGKVIDFSICTYLSSI